jgi:hypothetical protein
MNIPVTGLMLQAEARETAQRLHVENFQASNGWLESFRTRKDINFQFLSGELAAVDTAADEDWKSKLHQVINEYPRLNQFNADKTGLFYRQMPRKSLIQKGEKCKGGKLFKERLSVLFRCSATGEKLKPLVIGNAARPRAFKKQQIDTKHLPVDWPSNKKAWMTQATFEEWLEDLNHVMRKENRKILLLLHNATSHCVAK